MKILNRNTAPSFKTIDTINIQHAIEHQLSNNLSLFVINAGSEDLIKIEFIFNAGYWHQDKPLIAKSTNSMLSEGSKNFTSSEISEKIDFHGAHLHTETSFDTAEISLYSLTNQLPETIKILADILKNPTFPDNELSTFIKKKKQQFIIDNSKVSILARQKFSETIFGENHPYGRNIQPESFENITRKQLFDFHSRYYNVSNCKVIISGKVSQKEINIIENYFGGKDWNKSQLTDDLKFDIVPASKKALLVENKDAVQTAIKLGKVLFNKLHPDYIGMKVLNTVLGGYFGSRLMKNIREDKGYTYGISSLLISLRHGGFWLISSEVGTEVSRKAIEEIHKEIHKLQREIIPAKELELVKNYMLGNLLKNFDGPFALSESLKSILEYDLKYDYFEKYIDEIKNITAEELKSLAEKYLDINTMHEVTAGKKI